MLCNECQSPFPGAHFSDCKAWAGIMTLPCAAALPTMTNVSEFQKQLALLPQAEIRTQHVIHAGLYVRTITIPASVAVVGARIKRATVLMVTGDVTVSGENQQPFRVTGNHVLPASAGRKNAWFAHEDTDLTMVFPTTAKTVEDAEREFTDEVALLMSKHNPNDILITEE